MKVIFVISLLLCQIICFGQFMTEPHDHEAHRIYNWDWKKDGYILGGSFLGWGTSQYLKNQADKITADDLPQRLPENLWGIDRGATSNNSEQAQSLSDIFLYASFLLPLTHYSGVKCRSEGFVIGGMALETFFINDGITNTLKALTKRFRPYTYNPEIPIEEKLTDSARYSFVSGHASNTAALGFFSAKVFSDLYPDSKWRPVVWTLGAALPAMTGYLRYKGGRHFPTDIIGGYILGASVGFLVPHFHKISNKDMAFRISPMSGGALFTFTKTLK